MAKEKVEIEVVGKNSLSKVFSSISDAFSKFGLALQGIQKAAEIVGKAYTETVGKTIEYDDSVRKLSQNLSISTEESSKLIQITDDYGISIDQTSKALELAAKNGFEPTIENLADMADKLNAIEDPNMRAKEAAKIFGRQWADINPILVEGGDNIRNMAGELKGALIRTEEQVEASRKLDLQLDDLDDQWSALKLTIGTEVIPVLIEALDNINEARDSVDKWRDATEKANEAQIGFADYAGASKEAQKLFREEIEKSNNPAVALAYYETLVATGTAMNEYTGYTGTAAIRTSDYYTAVSDAIPIVDDLYNSQLDVNDAMADFSQKVLFAKASADLTEDAAFDLATSMGLIDQRTVFANERLGALRQMLDDGKISVGTYTLLVSNLGDAMDRIESKSAVITVDTYYNEHYGQQPDRPPSISPGGGTTPMKERAFGGPLTANQPSWIGENGPEIFIPNVSGYVVPSNKSESAMGGSVNNYNLTVNTNASVENIFSDFRLMKSWANV